MTHVKKNGVCILSDARNFVFLHYLTGITMTSAIKSLRSRSTVLLAHLGALITVTCWGTSFLCTKVLMEGGGFTPTEVYVYRFALAYLILLSITFRKILADSWKDELKFLLCGICCGSLYFITENYALKMTTTGNVSLLASVSPLFTTLLVGLIYRVRIKFGEILGSVLAFAGVACVIFMHGFSVEIHPLGDILALSASLSWAIYTIGVKNLIPRYSSLYITRKLFFYGVITALPLMLLQSQPFHLHLLFSIENPQYILNLLFLVIMCSIVSYLMWNEAMKVLGSVTANNYIYMQPIVTMIAAYFIFDERITILGYIGCALIIGGLIIADKLNFDFRRGKN